MNKQLNMEAFVGTGFDCEYLESNSIHWKVGLYKSVNNMRPRLEKPQVLDQYDWVKEVDGAVWDIRYDDISGIKTHVNVTNQRLIKEFELTVGVEWLSYKGQQAGLGYDEWCKAHGVPILEVGC